MKDIQVQTERYNVICTQRILWTTMRPQPLTSPQLLEFAKIKPNFDFNSQNARDIAPQISSYCNSMVLPTARGGFASLRLRHLDVETHFGFTNRKRKPQPNADRELSGMGRGVRPRAVRAEQRQNSTLLVRQIPHRYGCTY